MRAFLFLGFLLCAANAQVQIRAYATQLLDTFCFCSGSETALLRPDDLPYMLETCGEELELLSFNADTNILEVDGDGGRASVNLMEENYVYADRGGCLSLLHASIEDEDPLGYDEDIAYDMLWLTDVASEDNVTAFIDDLTPEGYRSLAELGYEEVVIQTFIPPAFANIVTEVLAYSAVNHLDRRIVAAFRGSNSVEQLVVQGLDGIDLDPVDFGPDFCDGCRPEVLEYFFDSAAGLLDAGLRGNLTQLLETYPDYEVLFAGYSLGGAMSNVAALFMRLEGLVEEDILVYTCGQPRVGNQEFVDDYDRLVPNTFRVVYNRDIVARFPTCNLDGCDEPGPNHVGTEIWYVGEEDRNESFCGHIICEDRESLNCSRSLVNRVSINDHRAYFDVVANELGFCGEGPPADPLPLATAPEPEVAPVVDPAAPENTVDADGGEPGEGANNLDDNSSMRQATVATSAVVAYSAVALLLSSIHH